MASPVRIRYVLISNQPPCLMLAIAGIKMCRYHRITRINAKKNCRCCDNTKYGSNINAYQDGNTLSYQIIYIPLWKSDGPLASCIQNGISYTGRTIFVFWHVAQNNTRNQSGHSWTEKIGFMETIMRMLWVIEGHITPLITIFLVFVFLFF